MKLQLSESKSDLFSFPERKKMVMHIDMNSYFAACEQQANPAWRGRPVGVCSYLHPKGTIIAASKEAKMIGIGTGTKVWEAKLKFPGIVLVRDDPAKYRVVTRRINKVFNSYTDRIDRYSIDESFLLFDQKEKIDSAYFYGVMESVAKEIKMRIKKEVGEWLTCSIGIAPTKFLAKIASDYKKPDGLTMISSDNIDSILATLDLIDIWGISWGFKRQLNAIGIFSPLELKQAKPSFLLKKMGKVGYFLWSRMNGLEIDRMRLDKESDRKSVGHSYTLLKKTANRDELTRIFMKLSERIGRRLRQKEKMAKVCWVGWRYTYGGGFARQEKMVKATDDSWDIFRHVYRHLARKVLHDQVSKVYLSVYGLEKKKMQLSFFEDELKKDRLTRSMDSINDKYGEFTVSRGSFKGWGEEMSDRIAFGN